MHEAALKGFAHEILFENLKFPSCRGVPEGRGVVPSFTEPLPRLSGTPSPAKGNWTNYSMSLAGDLDEAIPQFVRLLRSEDSALNDNFYFILVTLL